jgi:hypothetical protein
VRGHAGGFVNVKNSIHNVNLNCSEIHSYLAACGGEEKEREVFWGLPAPQAGSPRPRQGSFAPCTPSF